MKEFNDLQIEIGEWSDSVFGKRKDVTSLLNHLKEEIGELQKEPDDLMEYADCLMLLIDSARIRGFSVTELYCAMVRKLEINKTREWEPEDENGIIRHKK
jgi:hypothetical protein